MVNSDQIWRRANKANIHFFDIGFLKFAQNWNVPKFMYASSLGFNYWDYSKKDKKKENKCLKNFTDISVREKGSVNLVEKDLGITPRICSYSYFINR